jgi:hypothetical protein
MKNVRLLNPFYWLIFANIGLLMGCNFSPVFPTTEKLTSKAIENPAFNIPPLNQNDYKERNWILLAESKGNNWFYNPYSLSEDEDGVISFDAFFAPRNTPPNLDRFNASITGPFLQKIDCFGNHQWSEIFYADKMPDQETFVNPRNPKMEYGWIKIKPKSAMAYIRSRICGRKFIDDRNVNYFLFQEGRMRMPLFRDEDIAGKQKLPLSPGDQMVADYMRRNPSMNADTTSKVSSQPLPLFYEVINNEVVVVDAKKEIREMKVSSYILENDFPRQADYVFRANCQSKTYSFALQGKSAPAQELADSPESLANVAFNRACGDHGNYMKLISQKGR